MALAAVSTSAIITSLVLTISGASWVLALSLFNTIVQLSTPRWVVGRALSLYQTLTFGGIAVGSWLWGVLAEENGLTYALLCSCVLMLLGVVVGLQRRASGGILAPILTHLTWSLSMLYLLPLIFL